MIVNNIQKNILGIKLVTKLLIEIKCGNNAIYAQEDCNKNRER